MVVRGVAAAGPSQVVGLVVVFRVGLVVVTRVGLVVVVRVGLVVVIRVGLVVVLRLGAASHHATLAWESHPTMLLSFYPGPW